MGCALQPSLEYEPGNTGIPLLLLDFCGHQPPRPLILIARQGLTNEDLGSVEVGASHLKAGPGLVEGDMVGALEHTSSKNGPRHLKVPPPALHRRVRLPQGAVLGCAPYPTLEQRLRRGVIPGAHLHDPPRLPRLCVSPIGVHGPLEQGSRGVVVPRPDLAKGRPQEELGGVSVPLESQLEGGLGVPDAVVVQLQHPEGVGQERRPPLLAVVHDALEPFHLLQSAVQGLAGGGCVPLGQFQPGEAVVDGGGIAAVGADSALVDGPGVGGSGGAEEGVAVGVVGGTVSGVEEEGLLEETEGPFEVGGGGDAAVVSLSPLPFAAALPSLGMAQLKKSVGN
mmetsp:Transcript_5200/g.10864  ORF Transcript_5200/g.10864 Transcript_5200/m.10864 type:complete len:338 (+) Transcript_5200:507-1520(+)